MFICMEWFRTVNTSEFGKGGGDSSLERIALKSKLLELVYEPIAVNG